MEFQLSRNSAEQWTCSKLQKEYIKAIYFHPAYLTFMQCTSREMPSWMKQKPDSRFQGEMPVTSDIQITPPLWQKVKRNYRALMKMKEKSGKAGLK